MKKTTEDYLKTILLLQKQKGTVRSVAIAEAFGVSKPTVSNIIKRLIAEGYVVMDGNHSIGLTDKGLSIAEDTIERNRTIRDLLVSLGVDVAVAEADACEMEHVVSPQSLDALRALAAGKCSEGN